MRKAGAPRATAAARTGGGVAGRSAAGIPLALPPPFLVGVARLPAVGVARPPAFAARGRGDAVLKVK